MTVLLDTHAVLWFLRDDPQLSAVAKQTIEDPSNRKLVSIASCWEVAIKAGLGKLALGEPASTLLNRELPRNSLEVIIISLDHATAVQSLPRHHKDPFDRMLVVQSLLEGFGIVSADVVFDAYGVPRIW